MKKEVFICNNCPMTRTMGVLGSKWKLIILYAIGSNTIRFGRLHAKIDLISKKVLTEQLNQLLIDGIIAKNELGDKVGGVEYYLKEPGLELLPIMNELTLWNKRHF